MVKGDSAQKEYPNNHDHLIRVAESGDLKRFLDLLDNGASLDTKLAFFNINCVHISCLQDQVEILRAIFERNKVKFIELFSDRNFLSMTPLLVACRQSAKRCIYFFICLGILGEFDLESTLNVKDIFNKTALDWAVSKDNGDCIRYIVMTMLYIFVRDVNSLKNNELSRVESNLQVRYLFS